jgi:protoporphyrinogen oxidase
MKKYRVAVIGAGAMGLSAAYKLIKEGHDVVIFEQSSEIGGLAGSLDVQGTKLERFYHHSFTTDKALQNLAAELGLGKKLFYKKLKTGIFYDGKSHGFSTPFEMLKFQPVPLLDRIKFGVSSAYMRVLNNYAPLEPINALEWSRKYAGKKSTEVIWEPLLRSKFGNNADNISAAWLWGRVHFRTFKLGYMQDGFDQLYTALAEAIQKRGGEIRFNQSIKSITQKSAQDPVTIRMADSRAKHEFDRVVVTTSLPILNKLLGVPGPKKQPQYLAASCFVLELKQSLIPYYWLSVNDTSFPFLVVVEQTHLSSPKDYKGRHVIYVGNYLDIDDRRYTEDPAILLKEWIPYLQKINPNFKKSDILKWHFSKAPFAQAVITPDYPKLIPKHRTKLPGVWFGTLSQFYPEDRSQDYAIRIGYKVADLAVNK